MSLHERSDGIFEKLFRPRYGHIFVVQKQKHELVLELPHALVFTNGGICLYLRMIDDVSPSQDWSARHISCIQNC